jgi:ADP-heptose:LPS heptosyltransferase
MTPKNPRTVTLLKDHSAHGMTLRAGDTYVVEDPTLAYLLNLGIAGNIGWVRLQNNPGGRKVLISRTGGFGDILFCTPLIRALQASRLDVSFSCVPTYRDALSGVDVKFVPYPLPFSELSENYDRVIWLEGVIEFAERPFQHAVDLIAEAANKRLTEGKHCSYRVSEEDAKWAREKYPKSRKRVGIQLAASAKSRTYPRELMMQVIQTLVLKGIEVYLFGRPSEIQINTPHPLLKNIASESESFSKSCAVLATCDAVLAPDSALCHVAGALDLPTVALYGAFSWQSRTSYAPSVRALSGHLPCAPCHWHGRGSEFPPGGPCARTGRCEALATISPDRIVRELLRNT